MKEFIAIEEKGGYTELPNRHGEMIAVNNCQMLIKDRATDIGQFKQMLRDFYERMDVDVDDLSIIIYEVNIIKEYY